MDSRNVKRINKKCACGNDSGPFAPFVQMAKRATGIIDVLKCCECYDKERINNVNETRIYK